MRKLTQTSLSDVMSNRGLSLSDRSISDVLKEYGSNKLVLTVPGRNTPLYVSEGFAAYIDQLPFAGYSLIGLLNSGDKQIRALEDANVIKCSQEEPFSRVKPVTIKPGPNYKSTRIVGVEVNKYDRAKNLLKTRTLAAFKEMWQPRFYSIESTQQ